ncbi:1-acyl-sn-glycerol-3-phosphate acyltransferase [Portibacter marinus]|uniref:1-acyl-sn-glycerol-3-phosphate acyltransferase n=1 Tax=Portibacter marinus TaxID=2898660 RepID=UPI001F38692E|nr:1-acyl-sn-glycerol-3-phosphate acyltransferase [Portibacter marinus]
MSKFHSVYPHVLPNISDWPIYKLARDRQEFIALLEEEVMDKFTEKYGDDLEKIIAKTIYLEKKRCKENPWKIDPANEIKYWSALGKEFQNNKSSENPDVKNRQLLKKITNRYCEEILGDFKIKTFKFARRFLTSLFKRLLTAAADRRHLLWGSRKKLYKKISVAGAIEKVRSLMTKGTVVIVPTHLSNIDSILLGYAMDGVAGLPAFSYGAGLNLYDLELVAYFMDRLGAYKVDRRKKNPIYLETLKNMSKLSIERGVNSLFFPGGTRSRSGELERNLKMGLLGTIIEAQRSLYQDGKDEKIFLVPLTMSYNFVLEAKFLIENHLRYTGREKYIKSKDQAKSYRNFISFFWKLFSASSEIYLSFAEPMDVFGHEVDHEGNSYNQLGQELDLKEYFMMNGSLLTNSQRESVYTKKLADKILESFRKTNIVLASHMVAFTAFRLFKNKYKDLDLWDLVNLGEGAFKIPMDDFVAALDLVWGRIKALVEKGKASTLDKYSNMTTEEIAKEGIANLGVYHNKKPLIMEDGVVRSQEYKLLYYYHNRMTHYNIDIKQEKEPSQELILD